MKEVKAPNAKFCPKCTLGLDIKHTDVLILSQFLREDGHILPRRITGLCAVQQKNIGTMIIMAKLAGNTTKCILNVRNSNSLQFVLFAFR